MSRNLPTTVTSGAAHRWTTRHAVLLLATMAALALLTFGALAAEDRVLVEEGGDEVDRSALVAEVERVEAEGLLLSVSVLAEEPGGGAEAEADRIVDARGGAALVITPTEVGGVSDDTAHDTSGGVDRALDRLADDDDVVAATRAFSDHLLSGDSAVGIPGLDAADGAGSVDLPGIGRVSIMLIIVVVVGFILLSSVLRFFGRLAGGRRRGYRGGRRRRGGMLPGAAVGYGVGRARRNARSGAGGSAGGMSRGGSGSRASSSRGGTSRSRSSGSRSRSSGSRGGRARGSGRRR